MRAWILERYGAPELLKLREIPFPAFRDEKEVLVRVVCSSVNPADRHALHLPIIFRKGQGWIRPKEGRPGRDFAGRVEVVGKAVEHIHVGDEVFGVARGAFGEYAIADESEVAPKPASLSFEQASTLPIAGTTALQGLVAKAAVQPGQRVLINGASGGVGTFAVQIAKSLGANVSAVCSTRNLELVRSLGADRVFDYTREDFTRSGERFDVVLDTQLNHSLRAYGRIVHRPGLLLPVGAGSGSISRILGRLMKTILFGRLFGLRVQPFVARVNTKDLLALLSLVEAGKLVAPIDRRYPLEQVPEALRYLTAGHVRGKILVNVQAPSG